MRAVFGQELSGAAARGAAYAALKRLIIKQPAKYAVKECGKIIPFLGSAIVAVVSVGMAEAAGGSWRTNLTGRVYTMAAECCLDEDFLQL